MVLYDDSGQVTGYISVNRDITERKQAQSQRQFLYETLNASLNEIYLFDARTLYFEFVSEGALKNIGYSLEKLLQMTPLDLKPDYTPDSFETLIAPLRRHEVRAINFETRHRRANGSLYPVDVHLQLFVQAGRQVFLAIILDTTERKRAEEELQRTLKELKRSNEELEQFAYVASHDLQEPLRGIAGLVQLLGQRYQGKLDSRADEYISHIIDGTQRMQTLINDLLAYSRVGRHGEAIQTTSAEAALRATLNNLSAAIREYRATVTYDSLPSVRADATQLIQLFQNLIGNAIKFHSDCPPHIHIGVTDARDCWQFSVSDNGIGIEPQFFERIFQVFQRLHTRREYKGNGIGLAICKKIIERHGGGIWVESEPGAGSTFYFTLPKGA
jgi:PAS domain S-box-containing protein